MKKRVGCVPRPRSSQDDDLACLFRQRGNSLKLVVCGACESEECGLAIAKAGGPHVVAIRCEVRGTTNALRYPAFPVMFSFTRQATL